MKTLSSERYELIKKFIIEYVDEAGISPTVYEIADGTGIAKTSVARYVNAMIERGEIDNCGRRTLKPTDTKAGPCVCRYSVRLPAVCRSSLKRT